MKKKIATLVLCMAFFMPMIAQQKTDSFFSYQVIDRAIDRTPVPAYYDTEVGFKNMTIDAASLEGELLILLLVSLVYFFTRRKEVVE